ncbi:hypothetical protein [Seonamhaeicola sp. ML3]|uniref:hypothetical protein n=1 Tax=Seonamhaeicola sp. ML3 TaxID=2937786 RepID=UPI00200E8926|nr:hypothetical protein [Seonamhaeicola sp. ML3]
MIQLKIYGGFNSGLKVYSENDVVLFSNVSKNWPESDFINIYNGKKTLITSIKHINRLFKNKFEIFSQTLDIKSINQSATKGYIELDNGDIIKFSYSATNFFTNPYLKIFCNGIEIGKLNNRKFGFSLNYKLLIRDDYTDFLYYILIYILATESNKDYD